MKSILLFLLLFICLPLAGQFAETHREGALGYDFGAPSLYAVDLDGDGQQEIIHTGVQRYPTTANYWTVWSWDHERDTLVLRHISNSNPRMLVDAEIIPYGTDGGKSGYFRTSNRDFGPTTVVEGFVPLTGESLFDERKEVLGFAIYADVLPDREGAEMVSLTENSVNYYDPLTLDRLAQYSTPPDFYHVGYPTFKDLDVDGRMELIKFDIRGNLVAYSQSEDSLRVIGVLRGPVQTTGDLLTPLDYNNNGSIDLYYIDNDTLFVYDMQEQLMLSTLDLLPVYAEFGGNRIQHIMQYRDAQGSPLLVGISSDHVYILDARTLTLTGEYLITPQTGFDVSYPILADANGDGLEEIIWVTTMNGGNHFNRLTITPKDTILWRGSSISYRFQNFKVGDFLGNGGLQFVSRNNTSSINLDEGTQQIVDLFEDTLIYSTDGQEIIAGVRQIAAFFDPISQTGRAVALQSDNIQLLSLPQFEFIDYKRLPFAAGVAPSYTRVVDVTDDGIPELVVAYTTTSVGGSGGSSHIMILDLQLNELWRTPHYDFEGDPFISQLFFETGQFDTDPQLEFVVSKFSAEFNVYFVEIIDALTGEQQPLFTSNVPFGGIHLVDTDGDGREEILLGNGNRIFIYEAFKNTVLRSIDLPPAEFHSTITNLTSYDFEGDGTPELVTTHDGILYILRLSDGKVLWQSDRLGSSLGTYQTLAVAEVNGLATIFLGLDHMRVHYTYDGQQTDTTTSTTNVDNMSVQVQVYPNPLYGNEALRIVTSFPKFTYQLVDYMGRPIYEAESTQAEQSFDLPKLRSGQYFIIIQVAGKPVIAKPVMIVSE